jgi:hypothetical protein
MEIIEETRDLFSVNEDEYYLVQCISGDFATSTGINVQFDEKYNLKNKIKEKYGNNIIKNYPNTNVIFCDNKIFNLIIKKNYYQKPTYDSLRSALVEMKKILLSEEYFDLIKTNKIAMNRIGCESDELDWDKVKDIIIDIFKDTNVEILVCNI